MTLPRTGFQAVERRVLRTVGWSLVSIAAAAGLVALLATTVFRPNLLCGPMSSAESVAQATLKNLHRAQLEFRERAVVDRDGDGNGEFGWCSELAGTAPLRGAPADRWLAAPVLPLAFGNPEHGCFERAGYRFQLWLPAGCDRWTHEGTGAPVDAERSEQEFVAYAWPTAEDAGRRAFFLDASGDVFACRNAAGYRGDDHPVPLDAAFGSSDADAERAAGGRTGRDGDVWVCVQ